MFGDLFCGCRAVQNQFRKDSFRSAADTTVQIVADLTGDQLGVRSLGGKNQMDTKGTVQPYDGGHPALDLTDTLPLGLVQYLGYLVAGEDQPFQVFAGAFVVGGKVGISQLCKQRLSLLQFFCKSGEQI